MGQTTLDMLQRPDAFEATQTLLPIDAALWKAHMERKKLLLEEIRARIRNQIAHGDASSADLDELNSWDPNALTIGFARRFIEYKRGGLIFYDLERLIKTAAKAQRPIQLVFGGKAHPSDTPSQNIIYEVNQQITQLRLRTDAHIRAVFVPNYNVELARYLESGVDIGLNNPVRPMGRQGPAA